MFKGQYIFNQIIGSLSQYTFNQCVEKFNGNRKIRTLSCWQQFLILSFGQLGKRESLRDICLCFEAHQSKLYHLWLSDSIPRITLRDANEKRDYRIYETFAYTLIEKARKLYTDDKEFGLELSGIVYALDSTTIELCLNLFPWAKFRTTKAWIKLHTLLDLKWNIPSFIHMTDANVSDMKVLDIIDFEKWAFYVMDRWYLDFARLYRIETAWSYFVTRAKHNTKLKRRYSEKVTAEQKKQGVRCVQTVVLAGNKTKKSYPNKIRRIKYYDIETKKYYVFLTNNFTLPAITICELYHNRWHIELFFKWVKQHLKIQVFWWYSENAVKVQIWTAVAMYVLVAIIKKELNLSQSMNEILQILSISLFDKTPLNQLFSGSKNKSKDSDSVIQLKLEGF